ncbi:nucleoside hydrolase [Rubripirellula reticaptiva]|uniref:Inosine-uridine preferring nucleoside hydrolase n=1 Tax=Rubripirellula reticaptiva TaxID=2528013 RepID=A0A5C6F5N1_9BACT|nr:nucleoside hydrolase [Rubripirellula reticaptiva]TWU55860.1 Inosine-uridine preferring nucleoside hydrolase [Rubripirellula reticaptiva]
MMKVCLTVLLAFHCVVVANGQSSVKVIFDTDMDNDCDDAGALAVLHALADKGEAEILAVVTNRRGASTASAATCDVINTFYGRPDIPIGTDKDGAKFAWNKVSAYTPALRDEFPHDARADDEMPDALPLYRKTLADAADHSIVICSVGALSNLEDLVNSRGDRYSEFSGVELIMKKVRRTVIMGGEFPKSPKPETNIRLDIAAAVSVVNQWPGKILWQGYEVGAALHCGEPLKNVQRNNPIRRAFELRPFLDGFAIDRGKPAHDQAAVLLAVRGPEPSFWKVISGGRVIVDSDGHTEFRTDRDRHHQYVEIAGTPDRLTKVIDELMTTK